MKKINVLWLIEHNARELDVACAVKVLAKRQYGIEIEIFPINIDPKDIANNYLLQVIVVPYGYSIESSWLKEFVIQYPDAIVLNLNWEELYYNVYQEIKAPQDDWSKKYIYHHVWGEFYKNYLIDHGVDPSHIIVNGQPAYKLYHPPYNEIFPTRDELGAKYHLDSKKRWIFFPENYGWGFKHPGDIIKRIKIGQFEKSTLDEMVSFCKLSLQDVIWWLSELANDDWLEIIIRPRPTTDIALFKQYISSRIGKIPDSIKIIQEGSVREWIQSSDIVLSSYSTSLIEAAIAGKPAYMVLPHEIPEPLYADWYEKIIQIKTLNSLKMVCLGKIDPGASDTIRNWAIKELMSIKDPISNLVIILHDCVDQYEEKRGKSRIDINDIISIPVSGEIENRSFLKKMRNKIKPRTLIFTKKATDRYVKLDNVNADEINMCVKYFTEILH